MHGRAITTFARALSYALILALAAPIVLGGAPAFAEETVEALTAVAEGPHDTAAERDVVARAHFHLGELAEHARDYVSAVAHYRAVVAIDPGNWFASTARARIEALQEYDTEFAWLARLDAVRKDPARANDPSAIEALERDIETFPHGRARTEALLFIAEAWAGRLARPERAIGPAMTVAHDLTSDPIARDTGFALAYSAMLSLGDLDRASREIADDPAAPEPIARRIRRDARRRSLHRLASASLGFAGALLIAGLVEAVRRRRLSRLLASLRNPYALAFVAAAGLGSYVLAESWEAGSGPPFLVLAGVLGAVHVLVSAVRGGFGDRSALLRTLCAIGAACSVIAAAYLLLEHGETQGRPWLQGFGL